MDEIEVIFYIEGLGNDKKVLESALKETAESLRNEDGVKINYVNVEDILEDPENELLPYSGVIEAGITGSLESLIRLAIRYAPAAVEVTLPPKVEVKSEELSKLLGLVSYMMGELMNQFGPLAAYPDFSELPEPKIGYEREEIEELVIGDRNVLYRFVIEIFGDDVDKAQKDFTKALEYEGCRINKLVSKVQGENESGRKYILVATELLSDVETMFQLTAKYAPVAISVIEPDYVDITTSELQGILSDIAGFSHELVMRPVKKRIMEAKNTEFKLNS